MSRLAAADRAERAEADYSAAFHRKSSPVNARALSERGSEDERDTEKFDETEASDGVASYRESVCKPREPLGKPRGLPYTFTIDYGRKRRTRRKNSCRTRPTRGSSRNRSNAVSRLRSLSTAHAATPFPNEPRRQEALKNPKRRNESSRVSRRDSFAPDQRRRDSTE